MGKLEKVNLAISNFLQNINMLYSVSDIVLMFYFSCFYCILYKHIFLDNAKDIVK